MEELFKYEDRDQLYSFLIRDFGFVKIDEYYDAEAFGNYYIVLSSNNFLLRYIQDRSFLTIQVASNFKPSKWYDLAFIKNFIYNPDNINPGNEDIYSRKRIEDLNSFLKNDFERISNLLNRKYYKNTANKIDQLLRQQFNQEYPGKMD